jgi:hypothetical protein
MLPILNHLPISDSDHPGVLDFEMIPSRHYSVEALALQS